MAVRRPTLDQLRSVAEDLGMHMGEEELKSYDALMQANYAAYEAVDAMPDYVPAVKYPRTPGYRPEGEAQYRVTINNYFERKDATPGSALQAALGGILSDGDPRFTLQPVLKLFGFRIRRRRRPNGRRRRRIVESLGRAQ